MKKYIKFYKVVIINFKNSKSYVLDEYVDGVRIKANTWYRLKNGEFLDVN